MPFQVKPVLAADLNEATGLSALLISDHQLNNNSSALQNVTGLAVTGTVNTNYELEAVIFYISTVTADLKLAFTFPTGAVLSWAPSGLKFDGTDFQSMHTPVYRQVSGSSLALAGLGAATVASVQIQGTFLMGSTVGALQLQAAQQAPETNNPADRLIKADSRIKLRKV